MAPAGLAAMGLAAVPVLAGTTPTAHAYDATLWVLAGCVILHAGLAALMTAYLAARVRAGFVAAGRIGEARVVRLWTDYAALVTLLCLGAAWRPGALAGALG